MAGNKLEDEKSRALCIHLQYLRSPSRWIPLSVFQQRSKISILRKRKPVRNGLNSRRSWVIPHALSGMLLGLLFFCVLHQQIFSILRNVMLPNWGRLTHCIESGLTIKGAALSIEQCRYMNSLWSVLTVRSDWWPNFNWSGKDGTWFRVSSEELLQCAESFKWINYQMIVFQKSCRTVPPEHCLHLPESTSESMPSARPTSNTRFWFSFLATAFQHLR